MTESNSATAVTHNIVCQAGDTFERVFNFWTDKAKTIPADLSGSVFSCKVTGGQLGNPLLTFTMGAGFSVASNALTMRKEEENMQIQGGVYAYDIQQEVGNIITTIIKGSFTVIRQIT